jgi:hypothetical protein
MPRGYDSYLMSSLCQSESEGEPVTNVSEATPVRRPSLGDALPKIPIRLEGYGVSVSLRAGPHVRWHKVLEKWKACFSDSLNAPMAWPIVASIGGELVKICSIQESISRSVGPERLARVAEEDPAILLFIGSQSSSSTEPIDEADVCPPLQDGDAAQATATADDAPELKDAEPVEEVPSGPPESFSIKIVIESEISNKKLKLNVSSNCTVARLLSKWTDAAQIKIDPSKFYLATLEDEDLDPSKTLREALGSRAHADGGRVHLVASLSPKSSPKKRKKIKREAPTPPTAVPAEERPESVQGQQAQLEYWSQAKAAGLSVDILKESDEEEWEEDEEALAIALSLSEINR